MLAKNIVGTLILLFNAVGLGYCIYLGAQSLLKIRSNKENTTEEFLAPQKKPLIINDNIIPDEDDLLKDMDLSDLDNLNLDDFE